jgi:hypothetical protein
LPRHDDLAPLVGWPPNAQGMSSWKKCGTSVWKVRFTSLKNSARAGVFAATIIPTQAAPATT